MLFILLLFTIQIFDFLHLGYHYIDDNFNEFYTKNTEHNQLNHKEQNHNKCLVDSTLDLSYKDDKCKFPNQIDNNIQFDTNGILGLVSNGIKNEFHDKNDNSCLGHNQTHLFFSELDLQINFKLDYACHLGHLVLKLNFVKEIEKYFEFNNISKILKISTNFLDFPTNTFTSYSNKAPPLF